MKGARLTTLGTGTVALSGERSCAGYLYEADDVRLLLDCGSGITRRLAELGLAWPAITHVALTHFHIDHHGDLPTLVFAWKYGQLPPRSAPLDLLGPVGTRALIERLAAAYGEWLLTPGFPITIREIMPGESVELSASVRLSAQKVPHTEESVAYSIERGGRRVVYTGDTGPDDALADWAHGCDVLVCECSLPASMAIKEHLTPDQCASLAARARPGHVVLTHFYPPVERIDIRAAMAAQYGGPVTLGRDGWHIELEDE
ncbi:MAG: MBL fold metallo-hydrolase [Gemmatimonadetes bacterium]|nr:MAG: MBL fold metallo-hydrolase [Gemmatimonadota bacterium]